MRSYLQHAQIADQLLMGPATAPEDALRAQVHATLALALRPTEDGARQILDDLLHDLKESGSAAMLRADNLVGVLEGALTRLTDGG